MKAQLIEFFESNQEAQEVHTTLGYLCSTKEEAEKKLAGVSGEVIKTYTREQVEAMKVESNEAPSDHQIVASFKKMPVEKMRQVLSQQEEIVNKKQAGLMAERDQEKAQKSLAFHQSILESMKTALSEKEAEAKK
jgi:hypothetical protein